MRSEPHDHYCRCGNSIYHGSAPCSDPIRLLSCQDCIDAENEADEAPAVTEHFESMND